MKSGIFSRAATADRHVGEPAANGELRLESLTRHYAGFTAVDALELTVPQGSFFALLGPSGCGKTTTLRMIAGFEQPSAGRVLIGGTDLSGVKPYRRPVNTVFQSYALFPHLSVAANIAFGLKRRGVRDCERHVREMLELVQLPELAQRLPNQLSGGQQQRVALARALVNRPEVLLLDEPLGALDLKLRRQMQIELKRIQTEVGLSFVHVTHDQEEAMTLADTIAVMNLGRIEQLGSPAELYDQPRTTFVANFLGRSNLLAGTVRGTGGTELVVDVAGTPVLADRRRAAAQQGDVWVGVRPEKMLLCAAGGAREAGWNTLTGGVVADAAFIGVSTQYAVRMPWGQELAVFEQNTGVRTPYARGATVDLCWRPEHSFVLDQQQDARAGIGSNGGAP